MGKLLREKIAEGAPMDETEEFGVLVVVVGRETECFGLFQTWVGACATVKVLKNSAHRANLRDKPL